jgi:hypothetical protein
MKDKIIQGILLGGWVIVVGLVVGSTVLWLLT